LKRVRAHAYCMRHPKYPKAEIPELQRIEVRGLRT